MEKSLGENKLGQERIGKLLRMYAIPSIISMLVNSLYNIVDQIFIGQGVGYLGNGATNVCPSIHVIGSVAVMVLAWNSRHFHTPGWRIIFGVVTILISMSTVFLKQHSILDVFAAIPVCILAYYVVCRKRKGEIKWSLKQSSI